MDLSDDQLVGFEFEKESSDRIQGDKRIVMERRFQNDKTLSSNRKKHEATGVSKGTSVITNKTRNINAKLNDTTDILIMDTGGGQNCTITKRAFYITEITNHKASMSGYQDKSNPTLCSIVNAMTRAKITGKDNPVIFHINYATLIDNDNEYESLCVPFSMMAHGIKCDLTPTKYGG